MSGALGATFVGRAKQTDPLEAVEVDGADLQAMRNLVACKATAEDQRRVVEWLIKATAFKELEFRTDPQLHAFAGGKRWIGIQFFTAAQSAITER